MTKDTARSMLVHQLIGAGWLQEDAEDAVDEALLRRGRVVSEIPYMTKLDRLRLENARLRALIQNSCWVFEHYDLPEHAFHYRRALERIGTSEEQTQDVTKKTFGQMAHAAKLE